MRTKKSAQNRCIYIFTENIYLFALCMNVWESKWIEIVEMHSWLWLQYFTFCTVEKFRTIMVFDFSDFSFELDETEVLFSFSLNHLYIFIYYPIGPTEGYNALVTKQTTTDISASLNHLQTFIFSRVCLLFLSLSLFLSPPNVFYLFVFGWWVCSCSFLLPSSSSSASTTFISLSRCAFFIYVICSCYIWLPLTSNGEMVVLLFLVLKQPNRIIRRKKNWTKIYEENSQPHDDDDNTTTAA